MFNKPFECNTPVFYIGFILIKIGSNSAYYEVCRRDRITIIAQILKVTNTAVTKYQIKSKSNLNYSQLQVYLEMMLEKKLLVRKIDNNRREKFVATSKGKIFSKEFHLLQVLMT